MWKVFKQEILTKLMTVLAIVVTTGALLNYADAKGYPNEPNGFGELYWGESLSEIQGSHQCQYYTTVNGFDTYVVKVKEAGGDMTMRGPVVVAASFKNNRLHHIAIPLNGNYSEMIQPMTSLYGNPDKGNRLVMSWEGEKTDMILNILKPEKNVGVIMLYNAKAKQNVR